MKPKWMKRHFACPDCGLIVDEHDCPHEASDNGALKYQPFDCPRCGAHYTPEEFMDLNQDKWNREHTQEPEQP